MRKSLLIALILAHSFVFVERPCWAQETTATVGQLNLVLNTVKELDDKFKTQLEQVRSQLNQVSAAHNGLAGDVQKLGHTVEVGNLKTGFEIERQALITGQAVLVEKLQREFGDALGKKDQELATLGLRRDFEHAVTDLASSVQERLAELKEHTNEGFHQAQIARMEGDFHLHRRVDGVQGDVNGVKQDVSTLGGAVNSLGTRVSGVEGGLSTLGRQVGTLDGRVTSVEGDVGVLDGRVDRLASRPPVHHHTSTTYVSNPTRWILPTTSWCYPTSNWCRPVHHHPHPGGGYHILPISHVQ